MQPRKNLFRRPTELIGLAAALLMSVAVNNGWAQTLVPAGSVWKFLDTGTDAGTGWRLPGFNDASWASGPAQLGYGDGDEATVVSFGPNSGAKYITTYFRRQFSVTNPGAFAGITLSVQRDDGVVVYLNGTEVFRDNMPSGAVTYTTLATTAIGGASESTWLETGVNPGLLVSGENVLAVEVHQANSTSTDISFDLQLAATTGAGNIVRGPYLQQGTPNSVVLRWRTDTASDSRVRFGTDPSNLSLQAADAAVGVDHSVRLTGLQPQTRYYYELGNSLGWFAGDANDFFVTSPPVGSTSPIRVWVVGDSGTADANAAAVRNAYINAAGSRPADLWLMLGDNAYVNGTDAEYQAAVFNMYPTILRNTVLWSTRGNHEADSGGTGSTYYQIFTLPTGAEAGGVASGTESYYSFDYGQLHFVCLDSQGSSRSATGPMATWLREDLAATTQSWIIAYWHHPPYSKGSHNSDTEAQLIDMRANFLPILEEYGVDLVLCGHSHSYERSFLLNGHYGSSGTLVQSMIMDGGSGREDGTGVYEKPAGKTGNQGAVYAVAGSGGTTSGGALNHPAMYISLNELGSMILDVASNRLDASFLRANGTVGDYFSLVKGTATPTPPATPSSLVATAISSSAITVAWADNANNEQGFEIQRGTNGIDFSTLATVGANVVNGTDAGLEPGTTYYYRVRAFNAAGNSDFSNVGQATTPSTSETSGGLGFDGGNDYVTFGRAAGLGSATFTIETWFKRTGPGTGANTGSGGVQAIPLVSKGRGEADGSNLDMNYFLGIRSSDNVLAADFEEGAGGASPGLNHPVAGVTPITLNVWHHAAATYDGARWQLYLDGALEAEFVVNRPARGDSLQHAALGTALNSTGVAEGYFAGVLDEVRIWNYARPTTDITAQRDAEIVSAPGLVGRWALDETSGTIATDSSGSGIHGTLMNGPFWTTGAPLGQSTPGNNAPLANPDTAITEQGTAVTIAVLANDTDADQDPLIITAVTQGAAGSVTLNADYSVTYQPNATFTGQDTFTYTVSDGIDSAVGTVTVTVNPLLLFADNFESGNLTAGAWTFTGEASVNTSAAQSGTYGALLRRSASITKRLTSAGPGTVSIRYWRRTAAINSRDLFAVETSLDGQTWTRRETLSQNSPWTQTTFDVTLPGSEVYLRFRLVAGGKNDQAMIDNVEIVRR